MGRLATYGAVELPSTDNLFLSRRFSTDEAQRIVMQDSGLSPVQKMRMYGLIRQAEKNYSPYRGLISTNDILKAGVGAGLGYVGARGISTVIGKAVSLPQPVKSTINRAGAIGGALRAIGVWS